MAETGAGAELAGLPSGPSTSTSWPTPTEGSLVLKDFQFANDDHSSSLPELRLHYRTLGTLRRDTNGHALNAVFIMHGTGGSGLQFLNDRFAGELFNQGQLLDASPSPSPSATTPDSSSSSGYFIILRDGIGHGGSSKPSDGLHARFPHYGYRDMVAADYRLLTEHLGVDHLRLVMGTSMGGMHTWLWGQTYPHFMDALMPLASLPWQISGRNRMFRKMIVDSIRGDPAWKGGEYGDSNQPRQGLTAALYVLTFMSSVPLQWQKDAPDRNAADAFLDRRIADGLRDTDANDLLYQIDASRDYDPGGKEKLGLIKAPLLAWNSADDQVNPPELGILEREIKHVKRGRAVVVPVSDATQGHGSHTWAVLWKDLLQELLEESERKV